LVNDENIPTTPLAPSPKLVNEEPTSPAYVPTSPAYNPTGYNPTSPAYVPTSPAYNPTGYNPTSPPYNPTSPPYNPTSPPYVPSHNSQLRDKYNGKYSIPNSPTSFQPKSPSGPPFPRGMFSPTTPEFGSQPNEKMSAEKVKKVEKVEKAENVGKVEKKKTNKNISDIYTKTLVSKKISVEMKYIGSNIKENLEKKLKEAHEGKCIAEGYVKKNSIKIVAYSSGKICATGVLYEISFECHVCFPVEGQLLNCVATNITKAGIKATSLESPSPFIVFISRDHQLSNKKFHTIIEKDRFVARIIGQRFELNDPYISIIAEIDEKKRYIKNI